MGRGSKQKHPFVLSKRTSDVYVVHDLAKPAAYLRFNCISTQGHDFNDSIRDKTQMYKVERISGAPEWILSFPISRDSIKFVFIGNPASLGSKAPCFVFAYREKYNEQIFKKEKKRLSCLSSHRNSHQMFFGVFSLSLSLPSL